MHFIQMINRTNRWRMMGQYVDWEREAFTSPTWVGVHSVTFDSVSSQIITI